MFRRDVTQLYFEFVMFLNVERSGWAFFFFFFFVEVEEVGGNLPLGVDAFLIVRIVLLFENLLVL